VSAFQQHVRGDCCLLTEHISKQMNELNLERCRCIPKNCPGADWRVLEEIVKADPAREKFKVGAAGGWGGGEFLQVWVGGWVELGGWPAVEAFDEGICQELLVSC
jgi:hypothetical protein